MKFVIIGSGRGSNAEALLRAWQAGELGEAQPVGLFSDVAESRFLSLGPTYGVPATFLEPGSFRTKLHPENEARYVAAIRETGAELVVLAGFMRVLKTPFLSAFAPHVLNLHPSLLPAFKGLHAIQQAFDYGVKITGCTVHRVTPELDAGPILGQSAVEIAPEDTLETVAAKVHAAEHRLLVEVVRKYRG